MTGDPPYPKYVSLDKRAREFVYSLPFEELPLYVNDTRNFVKMFVLERLKDSQK